MDHVIASRSSEDITAYFGPEDIASIVYLSPDAEDTLAEFSEDKIYVIGGIVDKNPKTGLTYSKAKSLGIRVEKLPLDSLRESNKFRLCLNVNSVFNIIDNYRSQTVKDLRQAIERELPKKFRPKPEC